MSFLSEQQKLEMGRALEKEREHEREMEGLKYVCKIVVFAIVIIVGLPTACQIHKNMRDTPTAVVTPSK